MSKEAGLPETTGGEEEEIIVGLSLSFLVIVPLALPQVSPNNWVGQQVSLLFALFAIDIPVSSQIFMRTARMPP